MHLLKGKRKKSPEPPRQSDPLGRPAEIVAESSALQAKPYVILGGTHSLPRRDIEVDLPDLTIPPDEGGGAGPRIMLHDGMDTDQELPASGASTPGFAILDAGYGNRPTGESSWSLRMDSIDSPESLFLSLPAEGANDIEGDIGRTEASRGVRRYDDSVGSHLPCASREESS